MRHTYVGDLAIVLLHDGVEAVAWDHAGGSQQGIDQSFTLAQFAGTAVQGTWTLKVADTAAMDSGSVEKWAIVVTP